MPRFRGWALAWRLCILAQLGACAASLALIMSGAAPLNRAEQAVWVGAFAVQCVFHYALRARLEGILRLHRRFIDGFIDNALPPGEAGRRH